MKHTELLIKITNRLGLTASPVPESCGWLHTVNCGPVVITIADDPYTGEGPREVRIRALDRSWRMSAPVSDLNRLVAAAQVFVDGVDARWCAAEKEAAQ